MNKKERVEFIYNIFLRNDIVKPWDIKKLLNEDRVTIYRDIQTLIKTWKVQGIWKWKYTLKKDITSYFKTPFFERQKKQYNFDFLNSYIPNVSSFLNREQQNMLNSILDKIDINTDYYKLNRRLLETTLIDLSYASSYLEWNTYDYLDTEVLIKYNEIAKNKSLDDTQMILNHKKAIEYLLYYKRDLGYTKNTFFEIHTLLWDKLLQKEDLWVIRDRLVEIWASSYKPLETRFQLNEQFEIFLNKLNEIVNPFEQSLFILVFIPYFQIFLDINKRVSRMIAILPLIKNNLPIMSFLSTDKKLYITAILAIYELNDTNMLAQLYVDNYILNANRYLW